MLVCHHSFLRTRRLLLRVVHLSTVELLTLRGENAGVATEGGDTPLIIAARWGQARICEYLLTLPSAFSKASFTTGAGGVTAEETARAWGFLDLADYIRDKAAIAVSRTVKLK